MLLIVESFLVVMRTIWRAQHKGARQESQDYCYTTVIQYFEKAVHRGVLDVRLTRTKTPLVSELVFMVLTIPKPVRTGP